MNRRISFAGVLVSFVLLVPALFGQQTAIQVNSLAPTPPMGWNMCGTGLRDGRPGGVAWSGDGDGEAVEFFNGVVWNQPQKQQARTVIRCGVRMAHGARLIKLISS